MKFISEFARVTIECVGFAIVMAFALILAGGIVATIGRLIWLVWR